MKKSKELIKSQKEWYNKLKHEGFKDIEYFDKEMEPKSMLYREATKFAIANQNTFESTEQYYIEARQLYWEYDFEDEVSKSIWFYHAEGLAYRKIAKLLKVPYLRVFKTINKTRNSLAR